MAKPTLAYSPDETLYEEDVAPAFPEEGCTRCYCGAKYWDGTRCASCGEEWDGTDQT